VKVARGQWLERAGLKKRVNKEEDHENTKKGNLETNHE
jgi:hypothetical protein